MHFNSQNNPTTPDRRRDTGKNTQDRSPGGLTAEELQELSLLRLQLSMTDNVDDKQQGDAHVPEEPIAFPRDRFFRQQRSTTGKLAYVVFGITEECGVYYNWSATKQYLSTFRPYQKPDNRGYESYTEADEAWSFYKETGVVPLAPNEGGVAASIFDRDQSTKAHLPSPSSSAQASPAHQALSSSHTPQVGCTHPTFRAGIPGIFYIVHVGYSPGVYNSLRLAQNAISASDNHPIVEAASRAEANQNFVDAFMTGRVICTVDDE